MAITTEPQQDNNSTQKKSSLPHIIPALVAVVIFCSAVIYGDRTASSMEDKYIHALAPMQLPQTKTGSVLQQAAFRQPDLLPVYGASELLYEVSPYRSFGFFSTYPTGFDVFNIAKAGDTSLDIAQDLAAIGSELKGKKVVISFTPSMFNYQEVSDKAYRANYSRMHAYALAFSPNLSMNLKHRIALRMLDYPDTLAKDPVLLFALRNLAKGSLYNQVMYYMVFPLGQLNSLIIRMQDHFAVWRYLQSHPQIKQAVHRKPVNINWSMQIATAKSQQQAASIGVLTLLLSDIQIYCC